MKNKKKEKEKRKRIGRRQLVPPWTKSIIYDLRSFLDLSVPWIIYSRYSESCGRTIDGSWCLPCGKVSQGRAFRLVAEDNATLQDNS